MRAWLALSVLLAAPQDGYLPLKEGARWTYVVEELGAEATEPSRDVTAEVVASSSAAGAEWIEVRNFLGYAACFLRATPEAIDLKLDASPDAPALTILKLPVRTAEPWKGSLGGEELTFTVRGEEPFEIGDRRPRAVRVEFTASADKHAGHAPTRGEVWFVAGLGVVQAQVTQDLDCHSAATKRYRLKP